MVKTLGIKWLPGEDVFTFNANPPEKDFPLTKRNFLKKIAKLFDPVVVLAPFIIRVKILLQEMWTAGMDWDDLFLGDQSHTIHYFMHIILPSPPANSKS